MNILGVFRSQQFSKIVTFSPTSWWGFFGGRVNLELCKLSTKQLFYYGIMSLQSIYGLTCVISIQVCKHSAMKNKSLLYDNRIPIIAKVVYRQQINIFIRERRIAHLELKNGWKQTYHRILTESADTSSGSTIRSLKLIN